jgi:Regulator of ribonuclease activity B
MKFAKKTIKEFFAGNRSRGIDLARELLWTHHFIGSSAEVFDRLVPRLERSGLANIEVDATESGYLLQATEIVTHTVETLHARCVALDELGAQHEIEYDGFDAGKVDGSVLDA